MIFARIAAAFRKLTGRQNPHLTGLLTVEQTRKALVVERAVADRTGQCLSIIVFTPRVPEQASATWEILSKTLRSRLRVTDEAGWLDSQQICAILPFTPPAGATKVADDLCLLFPEDVPPPVCTIYSYPSGNIPTLDPPARNDDNQVQPARPIRNGSPATRDLQPVAVPLEPLFLRQMSIWKRTVDVIGASIGLLVLLPFLPLVALAIKLDSRGPIFFKQRRSGWGGRPFQMWKLRTMVVDAEARKADLMALNEQDGPAFKIKRDPRITKVGRILRSTSLDELPQLWNVLKGDMSLVGPRPLPCNETERCEPWQRRRLDVMPGLTCIWQVKGRSSVAFDDWVRMDVEYIQKQSLSEDLKLILLTVPAMVLRKGAH